MDKRLFSFRLRLLLRLSAHSQVHYPLWSTNQFYCGVAGVKMYRDGKEGEEHAAITDADGRWATAVGIGQKARFTPQLLDHAFSPVSWSGRVMGRVSDADTLDTLQRGLTLRLYGGQCDRGIATDLWRIRSVSCPAFELDSEFRPR